MAPMAKNFPAWLNLKQAIDAASRPSRGYKERDVWWVSIGHNVGFEEDGKGSGFSRPVLIVKGFSAQIFWGIPLTSVPNEGIYYYTFTITGHSTTSVAILSQLRAFDTRRFVSKMGTIDRRDFAAIKKQLCTFLS